MGYASTPQGPWPLGDHTPTPLQPPPSFSCPSPLHLITAPLQTHSVPFEHFPEPPPALFFSSVSLGMGDRIFLGPSAPLSHSVTLLLCCASSSKQASVPGWGSRLFMNLENYFCASKAKFEPILLEFIASSFRGWGGGRVVSAESPFPSPAVP